MVFILGLFINDDIWKKNFKLWGSSNFVQQCFAVVPVYSLSVRQMISAQAWFGCTVTELELTWCGMCCWPVVRQSCVMFSPSVNDHEAQGWQNLLTDQKEVEYSQRDIAEAHWDPPANRDVTSDTRPGSRSPGHRSSEPTRLKTRRPLSHMQRADGPRCSNHASLWCLCFCSSGHLLTGNTVHPASCSQLSAQLHKSPSVQQKYCVYTLVTGPKRI